jgi:hypothetical protein
MRPTSMAAVCKAAWCAVAGRWGNWRSRGERGPAGRAALARHRPPCALVASRCCPSHDLTGGLGSGGGLSSCSLGLLATSQQYFSLRTNQPPATSQQYFSLRTNQHHPSATSQTNRLRLCGARCGWKRNEVGNPKILWFAYILVQRVHMSGSMLQVHRFAGAGKTFLCPLIFYPRAQTQTRIRTRGHKIKPVSSP